MAWLLRLFPGMDRLIGCLSLSMRGTLAAAQATMVALRAIVLVTALMPLLGVLLASGAVRKAGERARRAR